jgi:hypothetical protein
MASTKLVFLAIAVLLLQASWCAVAQQARNSATMSLTSFEEGGQASCDGQYHSNGDALVALSTDLFQGGSMCQKMIYISNSQGLDMVLAEVVDECDTQNGCTGNMLATSKKVWDVLNLDTNLGEVPVTWTMA